MLPNRVTTLRQLPQLSDINPTEHRLDDLLHPPSHCQNVCWCYQTGLYCSGHCTVRPKVSSFLNIYANLLVCPKYYYRYVASELHVTYSRCLCCHHLLAASTTRSMCQTFWVHSWLLKCLADYLALNRQKYHYSKWFEALKLNRADAWRMFCGTTWCF